MAFNLKNILKALLMSTSEPLSIRDVQRVITRYHQESAASAEEESPIQAKDDQGQLEEILDQVPSLLTATQIRDAMDKLQVEFAETGDVVRLIQGPSGYRITTSPEYSHWVRLFRNESRPVKLSNAAMETLAIVAYRQPVTRAEMEAIRGVSVDGPVNKLQELELIYVTGRADLPGRPLQFATTEKFLDFAGLTCIEDLPASDVLSPSQLTEWVRKSTQQSEPLSDRHMGLAEEQPTKLDIPDARNDQPEFA